MTQKPNTLQIERTDSYKVGDKLFAELATAQAEALKAHFPEDLTTEQADLTAACLVSAADAVIEILAWGESARKPKRKPRSDIGKNHKKCNGDPPDPSA